MSLRSLLFGNVQASAEPAALAAMRAEVGALASEVRTLRLEWAETSDRLYRHMKRGEAAARRVASAEGAQPPVASDVPELDVETPLARRQSWGARGRRALRLQARGALNGAAQGGES